MAWYSSGIIIPSINYNWENTNISGATALSVKSTFTSTNLATLKWKIPTVLNPNNFVSRTFYSDKTYLFKTTLRRSDQIVSGMSFSIEPGWSDIFDIDSSIANPSSILDSVLYFYSKPSSTTTTKNYATYKANNQFGSATSPSPGIEGIEIIELNWQVNGFMYMDDGQVSSVDKTTHSLGWRFLESATQSGYLWFDDDTSSNYPVAGANGNKTSNIAYRENNYISKFINYQFFNFYFDYTKVTGDPTDGIKIYLSSTQPPVTTSTSSFYNYLDSSTLIAEIYDTGYVQGAFFNLAGGNYVVIVGSKSANETLIALTSIRFEGGYHPGNNEQYLMSLPEVSTNITDATYSTFVGNGNTINATSSLVINRIYSKIGNGTFKSGIWENGVWNNGWRFDENAKDFDDIDISIRTLSDIKWRWRITGPSASVANFQTGDIISIGNIVGIDINGDRKLLKDKYQILSASATGINERVGYITVESDTTFPFMRIEKDSMNHKIKVTKNVWLSGAFLNGYFTGVWNYGLFKGYPLITEMYDTHWIDGKFEGGHFNSENFTYATFSDTYFYANKVGLTFSSPHTLAVGDIITIDKDNKLVNPEYDGETKIIEVPNDYLAITDLDWGQNSSNESGSISTTLATGVIQNMDFKSLNVSKITSNVSLDSSAVFTYNSWMDLYYDETTATNIGKPQSLINSVSQKSYSENNLYGYITNDVLASNSSFRDSFSTVTRNYKLGTKYKVYSDFIGDSGLFENYFNPAGTSSNPQTFLNQGWTYSWTAAVSITFSRTTDIGQELITGKELQVQAKGSGGILDLQVPTITVNNRDNSELPKLRYTAIQFDLISSKVLYNGEEIELKEASNISKYGFTNPPITFIKRYQPIIHFNNLNFITREVSFGFGTYSQYLPASFLPINDNIDHVLTPKMTKIEYFFNKRNLAMHFKGGDLIGTFLGTSGGVNPTKFIIDNLKFYETDMIPFFQYFTYENINIGIQVPYQGIAPFINYEDSNFIFLDNINIGLDSFDVTSTFETYSGVGIGIGSGSGGFGGLTQDEIGVDAVSE